MTIELHFASSFWKCIILGVYCVLLNFWPKNAILTLKINFLPRKIKFLIPQYYHWTEFCSRFLKMYNTWGFYCKAGSYLPDLDDQSWFIFNRWRSLKVLFLWCSHVLPLETMLKWHHTYRTTFPPNGKFRKSSEPTLKNTFVPIFSSKFTFFFNKNNFFALFCLDI